VADYQAQIRLGVQGLGQLEQLERRLESAINLLGRLEQANANVGQAAESSQRNVERAAQRRKIAGRDLGSATRIVENVDQRVNPRTGRFERGPNATARRLANANLRLAQREVRESDRSLREELQNQRLISAAQQRYGRALDRAANIIEGVQGGIGDVQARVDTAMRGISRESRVNYLTNLFQGRQREFARGGGGAGLSPDLQQQARNVRSAFDIASAGGKENLQLMQRLATEMAGIVRQQNELNRTGAGRSSTFESARRGQEQLDVLAGRSGASQQRIQRIRKQAEQAIEAGNRGDIAGARDLTRRMKASIARYTRELDAAAADLAGQRRAGIRNLNVRQGWASVLEDFSREQQIRSRALPSGSLLAQRIATSGQDAPARLDLQQAEAAKAAAKAAADAAGSLGRFGAALEREAKRRERLGIGAVERVGVPGRRVAAIPMGGGMESGIVSRALPDRNLLAQRIAASGQIQPTRLDALRDAGLKEQAEAEKRAAGSTKRFADAVEREAKRLERLGIGQGPARGPGGAIPMGGQGGRPFNQLPFPAGPGNARGIAEFREIQRQQRASGAGQGFFRGSPRQAIGEGLIGGAFPLLFGQGLGASIGGAAGGFSGGLVGGSFGFGLSLVGTALGQAADNTVKNLGDLASSLKSPTDAIAALETSGFRVSDTLKLQVQQLQSVGRAYDAQTLVLQEVQKRLGPGSVTELNQLNEAQKKLQEQWGAIASEIQVRLLPVLQGFVEFLGGAADSVNGFANQSRLERLDRPTFRRLQDQAIKETSGPFGAFGNKEAYEARLSQLSREELSRRFAGEREQIKLSPQEALAEESSRIQESRRLADQVQSTYREAFKLQRQAYDLQYEGARFNKEVADYVWNKEGQIFALRQQAAERQAENIRAAAQNRIEQGDLDLRGAFAGAVGFEQQLLTNVRETMRTRKEGEADIEQSRKRLELTMAKLNRDTEDFKRTTAREIEDIERRKLSYVRSVEDYKMQVADHVLQRSREAADAMRQAMTLPEVGAGGGGGANASAIASSLISRLNLTPAQAAGVVGNFMRESGAEVNPRINEGGAIGAPARKGGYGIAQWTGPRQDALIRFAGSAEKAGDLGVQIDFLIRELRTSEGGALRSLRNARTPEEAAKVFERDFERSGIKALDERQRNARQFFNSFAQGASSGAPVSGGATFGRTGRMTLEQGYGMVDLRGSSRQTIISDAADAIVNRAAMGMRTWIGGGGGLDLEATNLRGDALRAAIEKGIRAHESRKSSPATAVDLIAKLGEPLGIAVGGISNRGGPTGVAGTTARGTIALHLGPESIGRGSTATQAMAATRISGAPTPQFTPVPIGPTPAAAPINAQRDALRTALNVGEQEAQKILEDQIRLRQKGAELGQIEQILNANQLPQLKQQGEELRRQVEARQQNVNLSDVGASIADLEAERAARLTQILKDRASALAQIESKVKDPKDLAQARADINKQSALALEIAVNEEDQRRKNLDLTNQLQASEGARTEILQLQQSISAAKVEAASLERRELEANNVELLKTTTLYQRTGAAQRERLESLTAELQELNKQNRVTAEIVQLEDALRGIRTESAAIQAGRLRATEVEQIRLSRGYREGSEAQRAEMEMLAAKTEELRKQNELGALQIEARFTGAGIRAGYVGQSARAFEDVMKNTGDMDQAVKMAEATKVLESQQLVWQSLEANIVSVSDAISGGLTNGLLDIIEGSREIEDVGREVLSGIARSFADSAQQQLNALVQRQLTGLIGSPLAGLLGGGQTGGAASAVAGGASQAAAAAGVQALGSASLTTTSAVLTFGAALQTTAAQMAVSGALGGGGGLFSAPLQTVPSFATALGFGGFLAEGGTTRPNEAYVVGENEPEFFFPGVTGRVVPRSDMEKAAALQDDSTSFDPLEIRYTVTEQRGERYVTEDQFRRGMAATTKRSQAVTMAGLRNSKENRNYVGI